MLLVDTNVLVDVLENDALWVEWAMRQLNTQSQVHELVINPVIYAELSLTFQAVEALDKTLDDIGLRICEIPRLALFLAGKAFACYRCGVGKITCWAISSWVPTPQCCAARCLPAMFAATGLRWCV